MNVTVETLAIGSLKGPRVYLLVRRVGTHVDISQMPDEVSNEREAHAYAAKTYKVPECDVKFSPINVVTLGED